MATHETGAFIHVFDGDSKWIAKSAVIIQFTFVPSADTKYGRLYVSDSTGSRFTLSLSTHLYEVHFHPMGHYSVHDFYEVSSARGVFITTSVDSGKQLIIVTF